VSTNFFEFDGRLSDTSGIRLALKYAYLHVYKHIIPELKNTE